MPMQAGRLRHKLWGDHLECSPCGEWPGTGSNNPLRMVAGAGGAAVALAERNCGLYLSGLDLFL